MLPSEKLKNHNLPAVHQIGSIRQTTLPALFNNFAPTTGAGPSFAEILNTLRALRNTRKITLWKYSGDVRVPFDQYVGFEGTEDNFFSGSFGIEIVPEAMRYFEELEERSMSESDLDQPRPMTRRGKEALAALQQQLAELEPLREKGPDHPHFSRWKMTTGEILKRFLPHTTYRTRFINITFRNDSSAHYRRPVDPAELFARGCDEAQACLEGGIDHIRRLGINNDSEAIANEELRTEKQAIVSVSASSSSLPTELDQIPRKPDLLAYLKKNLMHES